MATEKKSKQDKTPAQGIAPAPRTQRGRRLAYGFNVLVVVVVAIAITALVNYIGDNYLSAFRKDLTATGEYSLSPQTKKVVSAATEPVQIISLFGGSQNPQIQTRINKALGLVQEYDYISPKVTVEQIDPLRDAARLEAFYATIRKRYEVELEPLDAAIKQGMAGMNLVRMQMKEQVASIAEILAQPDMPQGKLPQTLNEISRVLTQQEADFDQYHGQIQSAMDRALADYGGAATILSTLLQSIDQGLFAQAGKLLDPFAQNIKTPDAIRNKLLKITDQISASRRQLKPVLDTLAGVKPLPEYDQLYQKLANTNVVVLVGEKEVQVVTLEQMFKAAQEEGILEPQFLGEERITGALLGMQQKIMPMVVFVSNPQMPALGSRGLFQALGQRLENSHFRVEEWSPQGKPGPMMQMSTPQEPPKAEPGQRTVWIILPMLPNNPMMPMQSGGAERVISLLEKRASVGDGAMLILSIDKGAAAGMANPLTLWAQDWGITAYNDRMILREKMLPDHKTAAQGLLMINQWPDDLVITRALSGFTAVFAAASPLELKKTTGDKPGDPKVYPLAIVTGQGLWAEQEPDAQSQYKPETAADQFIIAAASEKGPSRLVVVADPVWATDQITTNASVPGNAELFVNSVYWLSGLDQMIAASARTQDIRRIADIKPGSMIALRWSMMLGMPLLVAAAGLGVWFVRRRD